MKHRIGLVGCGWVAPFHVRALAGVRDRVEVAWVSDPRPERTKLIASQITRELSQKEPVRELSEYKHALPEVDSVFILLPHHLHCAATIEALSAGCNVLLEKPMAIFLSEADQMIAKAEEAGKLLMIALPHRYRKSTQAFKRLIECGEYGKPYLLD